jgi:hypothetical protein
MTPIRRFFFTIIVPVCLFMPPSGTASAQNPGDSVFAGSRVYTFRFQFSQPNFWDSLGYYHDLGTEQYMMADATIDGTRFDSIGVRLKGNSSYTYPGKKKSIRLDFGEYRDAKWDGLKAVHLNNGWGDPSFMREKIYLDFCRDAGIAAPRANFARVYINDSLFGLYSLIEHVDKRFLKNHYANSGGDLFKAVDNFIPGGPSQSVLSDFLYYGPIDTSYASRYEMKTDGSTTAWPKLIAFVDSLNNVTPAAAVLREKCNLPAFNQALAMDILFGNLDSYIGSGRNFYFYFNQATGKIEWIIWDTGLSFGVYSAGVSRAETMSLLYVSDPTQRPLVNRIFADSTLKREYLLSLCALFNGSFTQTKLNPHIDSVAALIRPYVIEDPRKMYTVQQFETNISSDINADGGGGTRKPGLKSFISARRTSIQSQLTALGISCALDAEGVPPARPNAPALTWCAPQPAGGMTTFYATLPAGPTAEIMISNTLGRVVHRAGMPDHGLPIFAASMDLSSLPPGSYLYSITRGGRIATGRISIVR